MNPLLKTVRLCVLTILQNLKITTIELIAEKSWYLTDRSFSTNGLPIHSTLKSYMLPNYSRSSDLPFPGWRANLQKSLTKRNFNTWQVSSYHSLLVGAASIESITFYCLRNSVCGIAFERQVGESVELLGSRNPLACAIHLEFKRHECLGQVLMNIDAMRMEGYWGKDRCPSLVVSFV